MPKGNKEAKKPKKAVGAKPEAAGAKPKAGAATGFTPAPALAGKGKPKKA
jgi:hypothetical protein